MVARPTPDPLELPRASWRVEDPLYPDSDGEPMADNTLQFSWIVLMKENLDALLPDFVGGDLLWYAVEGKPKARLAPDVLVALGRPKGYRGSYKQWVEGQPPTVVIEVLSPRNTLREMVKKASFYGHHGAREFIVVDPENETGFAHIFEDGTIVDDVPELEGWTSPSLGIRFEREDGKLVVIGPDGKRFEQLGEAQARAEQEAARADREAARARALAEKLRAAGLDPDA